MTPSTLPVLGLDNPPTFKSRGVAVPFTTPLLAGTRMRESKREGVELVLSNPSGARGIYVLNWAGVRAICNPTVYDTVLFQRAGGIPAINPASIRDLALAVALEGRAGRDAAMAAKAAIAQDDAERILANLLLVVGLVEQMDPNGPKIPIPPERTAELDRRATVVLHRTASLLGQPAAHLASGLKAIATLFAPVGIAATDRDARIPRLLMRIAEAHSDLAQWLAADAGHDIGGIGESVSDAMKRTCETGVMVLRWTRAPLVDTASLLKQWISDPDGLSARARRCDWLMDGWERVCLLWLSARTRAARRAALLEMAPIMPILPREAIEWTETPVPPDAMRQTCRVTSNEDAWRIGGSAFGFIERNEKLLATGFRPPSVMPPSVIAALADGQARP